MKTVSISKDFHDCIEHKVDLRTAWVMVDADNMIFCYWKTKSEAMRACKIENLGAPLSMVGVKLEVVDLCE